MGRGPKKHLKRVAAPSKWMLDKMSGVYAPKPSPGPHKHSECMPLIVLLRNQLKYALTGREVTMITHQRLIKVDGKVRTDETYPLGFMDVISIDKTGENFRLLYNTKKRFVAHKIRAEEATYKLCRVKRVDLSAKKIPFAITHDGRSIRFVDPNIKTNDTIRVNIQTGQVMEWLKFEVGMMAMITGGHNLGRVGIITHREKHPGSFEVVHVKDSRGHAFATRLANVFVIGKPNAPYISLPKDKGIRDSIMEDRQKRLNAQAQAA